MDRTALRALGGAVSLSPALDEDGSVVVDLALSFLAVAFLAVTDRKRGVHPQGRPLASSGLSLTWWMLGFATVLIAGWAMAFSVGVWAALGSGAVAYVVLALHERSYARAADRLRAMVESPR